ncbi:carbohydrate ABC transporter permease [Azospirillum sp. A29]|uniref:carbohydrate ABC transporter permease n=1 Tax=Azospirillum sp. A29 TaxID=3160606 RepID=UPI003671020D
MTDTMRSHGAPARGPSAAAAAVTTGSANALMRLTDPPMRAVQRLVGAARMPYVFLLPNLLFFGLFVFLPIGINIVFSVTGGTGLFPSERPYVGAEHYARLLDCGSYLEAGSCREDLFWRGVGNTLTFTVFQMVAMVLFSLVTALVLNRPIRGRGFFRAVYFFPVLLSPVVVALIWKWILQRDGLLNAVLTTAGGEKILFFVDPGWAMFWSVFVSVWAHMGFYTLILLAGLQAIPRDVYEAAEMDGTRPWRVFHRITLPLLWPNLLVVLVLVLIRSVQVFDEVFVLTGGGPGTATMMVVQYIYTTAFANQVQNFGLAGAASVLLGAVLFVLTLIQLFLTRRRAS